MSEVNKLIREIPFLCRMGFHWREWRATIRRVDVSNQSEMIWFKATKVNLDAKLHTSTGKCKRCNDVLVYYMVYDVEEAL